MALVSMDLIVSDTNLIENIFTHIEELYCLKLEGTATNKEQVRNNFERCLPRNLQKIVPSTLSIISRSS